MKQLDAALLDALPLDFALGLLCGSTYVESDARAARARHDWHLRVERLLCVAVMRAPPESLGAELRLRVQKP